METSTCTCTCSAWKNIILESIAMTVHRIPTKYAKQALHYTCTCT